MGSNIVGAPSVQEITTPGSLVDGLSENKVITIHNPLPDDFRIYYARSNAASVPLTTEERRIRELAGLPMTKEGPTVSHQSQELIFKAGDTRNFPGDIGQKLVRDMTTYIIQNRNDGNDKRLVADFNARREVEEMLIVEVLDNVSFLNTVSPEEYTRQQLEKLNPATPEEKTSEVPFNGGDAPNPPTETGTPNESKAKV